MDHMETAGVGEFLVSESASDVAAVAAKPQLQTLAGPTPAIGIPPVMTALHYQGYLARLQRCSVMLPGQDSDGLLKEHL